MQLGVPAYGRHWVTQKVATEVCPNGVTGRTSFPITGTAALAATAHRTPTHDVSGELTFSWDERVTGLRTTPPTLPEPVGTINTITDIPVVTGLQPALRIGTSVTCTVHHTVFAPDPTNLTTKAQRAADAGWSGIVMWALGYETSDLYTALGTIAQQRSTGSPVLTLDTPVVAGAVGATPSSVQLTGIAYHPEFDLPVSVTLTVTGTNPVVAAVAKVVTARDTRPDLAPSVVAALGTHHGFNATLTGLAAGTYRVCATAYGWGGVALATSAPCPTFVVPAPA